MKQEGAVEMQAWKLWQNWRQLETIFFWDTVHPAALQVSFSNPSKMNGGVDGGSGHARNPAYGN